MARPRHGSVVVLEVVLTAVAGPGTQHGPLPALSTYLLQHLLQGEGEGGWGKAECLLALAWRHPSLRLSPQPSGHIPVPLPPGAHVGDVLHITPRVRKQAPSMDHHRASRRPLQTAFFMVASSSSSSSPKGAQERTRVMVVKGQVYGPTSPLQGPWQSQTTHPPAGSGQLASAWPAAPRAGWSA